MIDNWHVCNEELLIFCCYKFYTSKELDDDIVKYIYIINPYKLINTYSQQL